MKIAVTAYGDIPSEWAHSINTVKHANGFFKLGHDVTLFSPLKFKESNLLKKIKSIHDFYYIDPKIKVNLYKSNSLFFFSEVSILHVKFYGLILKLINSTNLIDHKINSIVDPEKKIAEFIKKNNFDLAYCRSFRMHYYLINSHIPTILESHNARLNPTLKLLLKVTCSEYFRGISTISYKLKKQFEELGVPKEKIVVQEDAVDLNKFNVVVDDKLKLRKKLNLSTTKKIITYCGSLRSGKGIYDLLAVAKKFNANKSILFLIVGGPNTKKRYFEKISRKEKITNVKFVGFVPSNHVPRYLKSSDILIMLYSLKEPKMIMDLKTTSPMKLFEYMASKVPIVTTKIPTIKKIVRHNQEALLSKINDIEDITSNINLLIKDTDLQKKLSENAFELVKKHTYEKRCEKMLEQLL